MSRWII